MLKPSGYTSQLDYSQPGTCQKTMDAGIGVSMNALTVCTDGRLVSGDSQKIQFWNLQTGACQQTLKHGALSLLECSPGRLASGGLSTISIWDMSNGKCKQKLDGHDAGVSALLMCTEGQLASGSYDNTVKIWDLTAGKRKLNLRGHDGNINDLALCPDGRVVSCADDNTIKLWDLRSGTCQQTLRSHTKSINALTSYGGGWLASASHDKTIKLWNLRYATFEQTLNGHAEGIEALVMCSNNWLASGARDKTIKIWDVSKGICLQTIVDDSWVGVLTLALDGRLVSAYYATIKLWNFPQLAAVPSSVSAQAVVQESPVKPVNYQPVQPKQPAIIVASQSIPVPKVLPIAAINNAPSKPSTPILSAQLSQDDVRQKAESCYEDGNYADAIKWYRKLATKGDDTAIKMVATLEKMLSDMKVSASAPVVVTTPKPPARPLVSTPVQVHSSAPRPIPKKAAVTAHSTPSSIEQPLAPKLAMEVSYAHLTFEKELGKGGFGVVHRGQWQRTTVAIKQLITQSLTPQALSEFTYEAQLMSQLRHPNIVTFYKICTEPGRYCIVMEYCEKGSLYGWLRTPESNSWQERMRISVELAKGLMFLHEHKILHRDLKGLNVLLDKTLTAKITDFGLSKVKTETTSQATGGMKGTLRWNPPELISGEVEHHSEKTDIYSLGMTFWEIASRKIPFESQGNEMIVANWIAQGKKETVPADTPAPLAQLIGQCWDKRSAQRPTAQAAVDMLDGAEAKVISSTQSQDYRLASAATTQQGQTNNYRLTS